MRFYFELYNIAKNMVLINADILLKVQTCNNKISRLGEVKLKSTLKERIEVKLSAQL